MTSPQGPLEDDAPPAGSAETLAALALAGDRQAFEALVTRLQGPAWALARKIVGDREVASEMVQEAFLRVHTNRETFRIGQRFKPGKLLQMSEPHRRKTRLAYRLQVPSAAFDEEDLLVLAGHHSLRYLDRRIAAAVQNKRVIAAQQLRRIHAKRKLAGVTRRLGVIP